MLRRIVDSVEGIMDLGLVEAINAVYRYDDSPLDPNLSTAYPSKIF